MRFKIASYYSEVIDGGENLANILMIISPNFVVTYTASLSHVFPKPLSRPLSGNVDHLAHHPASFAVTGLVPLPHFLAAIPANIK